MTIKVAVLVGSLRKGSFNRKMAKEMMRLAPESLDMSIVEIGNLPLFNEDLESNPPKAWVDFREVIRNADAILIATPEYNRSTPPALKNALDVGSRPYGQSVWGGKPVGVFSVSLGATGGFGANHHLRQSFVFLDMPCMQQPEAYFSNAGGLFDDNGLLVDDKTKAFVSNFISAYERFVTKQLKH